MYNFQSLSGKQLENQTKMEQNKSNLMSLSKDSIITVERETHTLT